MVLGRFRWVCTSGKPEDLDKTDNHCAEGHAGDRSDRIPELKFSSKWQDNIKWIEDAETKQIGRRFAGAHFVRRRRGSRIKIATGLQRRDQR